MRGDRRVRGSRSAEQGGQGHAAGGGDVADVLRVDTPAGGTAAQGALALAAQDGGDGLARAVAGGEVLAPAVEFRRPEVVLAEQGPDVAFEEGRGAGRVEYPQEPADVVGLGLEVPPAVAGRADHHPVERVAVADDGGQVPRSEER